LRGGSPARPDRPELGCQSAEPAGRILVEAHTRSARRRHRRARQPPADTPGRCRRSSRERRGFPPRLHLQRRRPAGTDGRERWPARGVWVGPILHPAVLLAFADRAGIVEH
jgi:hypothetical protein